MTQHFGRAKTEFYLTSPSPCPYLKGRTERKVFAFLGGANADHLNNQLTARGFRRSQNIIYTPSCQGCNACVPVRIPVAQHELSRNARRTLKKNADLYSCERPPSATSEQFGILRAYLDARHATGGMADMTVLDYMAMVEETAVDTVLVEYRETKTDRLVATALTDRLTDGVSMIYSFFDPDDAARSLGDYMILDHIERTRKSGLAYVYLGYWVAGSPKMAYKSRYKPLEMLGLKGWAPMENEAGANEDQYPPAP